VVLENCYDRYLSETDESCPLRREQKQGNHKYNRSIITPHGGGVFNNLIIQAPEQRLHNIVDDLLGADLLIEET
jgi:hypothetical protein